MACARAVNRGTFAMQLIRVRSNMQLIRVRYHRYYGSTCDLNLS